MITKIKTMTINQIVERKDDLLVSTDDIKGLARNVRNKAIDKFVEKLVERIHTVPSKCIGGANVMEIAEQMKAGDEV